MTSEQAGNDLFSVAVFQPADAPGVAELFRTVYGEGYPVKIVYDPEALIAAFETRENIPVVARGSDGRIIAYMAFYRSAPNKAVYEAGQGLVHPDFRGKGVITEVGRYTFRDLVHELGAEAIFGEAVCNHLHMQKTCASLGWIETALEVDLMPQEAYVTEQSASGRVSTLFMGMVAARRPALVHLPPRYEDALRYLYEGTEDRPGYRAGVEELPDAVSHLAMQVFDFAGVARMTIHEAGRDLENLIEQKESELVARNVAVIQVWLKLSWPFVGAITEVLRRRSYFLGGLIPRWFADSDGLLMQKLTGRPNWEGIRLYSKRAEQMMEMVRNDWTETGARPKG